MRYDGTRTDDASLAQRNPRHDYRVCPNPDIVAYFNRATSNALTIYRDATILKLMSISNQFGTWTNQYIAPYPDNSSAVDRGSSIELCSVANVQAVSECAKVYPPVQIDLIANE